MGGQFQAEGEEQFHYSLLKPTPSAPVTPEIILDEPRPYKRLATPPNPPPILSTPKGIHQPLSATTPDSPHLYPQLCHL